MALYVFARDRNDTWFSLKKGPNYAPKRVKPETDLTRDLLQRYARCSITFNCCSF